MKLKIKNRIFESLNHTCVMGILNVTPDSFSDGGKFLSLEKAVSHAQKMIQNGAEIIDIGGESSRPGSKKLSTEDEVNRVIPVICELRKKEPNCIISVDTCKSSVAQLAIDAGADIVNDITGLQYDEKIADVVAETGAGLILMHMRGTSETMQNECNLVYDDVVKDIYQFLDNATKIAISKGCSKESIVIDVGLGFAKTVQQNVELLKKIDEFKTLEFPILMGPSRKSFIGALLDIPNPEKRIWGTGGVVAYLANKDIDIIRVHDVREMKEMLIILDVLK